MGTCEIARCMPATMAPGRGAALIVPTIIVTPISDTLWGMAMARQEKKYELPQVSLDILMWCLVVYQR